MRCACKCDAIRQVQALRRSCRRSPETENEALPNRRAHVGKVIDAGANDYNRFYTPTSLDGDGPRRRRTSDRDTGVADKAESLTGCKSLYRQLPVFGRLAYPERAEVTKHDMPGRKSLGCPVGRLAAVGAIWETTQTQRPEHNEMSASSKTIPRKVAFAERNRKPTHSVLGKADDIGEETRYEHSVGPSGQGTRHLGKDLQR